VEKNFKSSEEMMEHFTVENQNKKSDIEILREMKDVQSHNLTDEYMIGLYNGIEYSLSILEGREPEYKDVTETLKK
jgi:hypothetical protein